MCGRSSLHDAPVNVLERFHLPPVIPGFAPRYNIAPSQEQWTILLGPDGSPEVRSLKWGLVPSWASDPTVGQKLCNARDDSVAGKPSFQESFRQRRCLILTDGYYEWQKQGKTRVPLFFHLTGHRAFALAGLWDRWTKGGAPLETCTIITTEASSRAAIVHHRMPVVLTLDGATEWLSEATPEHRLMELMAPYEDPDLVCYEVSRLVNATANDTAECIVPAETAPHPEELTLWDM